MDACVAPALLSLLLFSAAPTFSPAAGAIPAADAPADLAAQHDLLAGRERESLDRGVALIRDGLFPEGETLLREVAVASLDPHVRLEAWARLGESELRSGAPGAAGEAFSRALATPGVAAEAWRVRLWEGAARAAAGDARGAVTALREASRDADPPERLLAHRWAGWLEWSMGEPARAREIWRAGLRDAPHGGAAGDSLELDLAESWFAGSAWDSVIATLAPEPTTDRGRSLLGWALFMAGEPAAADTILARLTGGRASGAVLDPALLLRGWIALERGASADALAWLRRIDRAARGLRIPARYATALAAMQQGAFAAADSLLALSPEPREADPLRRPWTYARAYARFRQGRYAESVMALGPVSARAPLDRLDQAGLLLRADADFRQGHVADAYAGYVRAASREVPATQELLWRQAVAALGSEQWGAAARVLDELLLKFPGAPRTAEFHFWRGESLYRLGRLAEARTFFTRAERLGGDAARCAYALGGCDFQEERWEAALHGFDHARSLGGVGTLDGDLALRRGECLRRLGRDAEAAAALAEAETLAATDLAPARESSVTAQENRAPLSGVGDDADERRAAELQRAGRFREAQTAYRAWMDCMVTNDARRLVGRFRIAQCFEALGELRDAAAEYAALSAVPGFAQPGEARLRAGRLWIRAGEPRRALGLLQGRSALALGPAEAARTHALAAEAFESLGEETAAANEWEKVTQAGTGAPDSLRALGQLHLGRRAFSAGEWEAAYAAFAAADSLGTLDPGARAGYWAGESAAQLGDCDGAILWFERYLTRDGPEPEWEALARMRLGQCCEDRGRGADAREAYRTVLRLPGIPDSLRRQARQRLNALDAPTSPRER